MTTVLDRSIKLPRMHGEEALWKQRFESLCMHLDDLKIDLKREQYEVSSKRAWDASEVIYVSFSNDMVDSEDLAINLFGEGNYDTYRIERRSPK